eukprot:TRINITY_DN12003_c0_g1_i1.p1 TRINITY_DN12003_c0_g1~~TRINITY_DN12003_c0_g1_i1.p1  ORF type:complete len:254 (-),score=41.40 TRINITY_DN12003_c0_g1_i1:698-1459(-)
MEPTARYKQDFCPGRTLLGILNLSSFQAQNRWESMVVLVLLVTVYLLQLLGGATADGNVTLESIGLATTHEWLGKPTVYFACQGEEKVYLPDVRQKHVVYNFTGLESFQPLTSLIGLKCKRCGFYEEDQWKRDDVFYEWELCPSSFKAAPENRFSSSQEKELDISLLCPGCHPEAAVSSEPPAVETASAKEAGRRSTPLIAGLVVLALVVLVGVSAGYLLFRKKQREEQHRRFIQLFDDDDDLDEELGLKDDL